MVARVISDPTQDLADDLECTAVDKDLPQAQLSFDDECEMIKSLLRKSQVPSLEDEFVGSVSTLYPADRATSTPTLPPPGFGASPVAGGDQSKQPNLLTTMPSFDVGLTADHDPGDTMIVLPSNKSSILSLSTSAVSQKSRDVSTLTSSPVQLFAGAPLFALPSLATTHDQSFFDEFRQNGQEVPSTPAWGAAAINAAYARVGLGMETHGRASSGDGVNAPNDSGKAAFSWASITKSSANAGGKGDSSVDVLAEQRLCRILEKFIEVFGCTYEEARSLLELMQAKYDLLTSTPMELIVNAARDLIKTEGERRKSTCSTPTAQPVQPLQKEEDLPWNYKTVMCNFHKDGMCRLGDKCMFAHSKAELREPFIPNGFCIAFVTKGVCKWGSSCNYIHESPCVSKKQNQSSEKLKMIKGPDNGALLKPRVPVGFNFVSAAPTLKSGALAPVSSLSTNAVKTPSVCLTSNKTLSVEPNVSAATETNGNKGRNKSKKDKEKEDEEWSKVSRGAKPVRAPELRSPAAIVATFQLDNLCVLCRDQVSTSNNRITLECGHSQFHRGCIKDWLKSQSPAICPVCKSVSNLETEEALAEAASKKKK